MNCTLYVKSEREIGGSCSANHYYSYSILWSISKDNLKIELKSLEYETRRVGKCAEWVTNAKFAQYLSQMPVQASKLIKRSSVYQKKSSVFSLIHCIELEIACDGSIWRSKLKMGQCNRRLAWTRDYTRAKSASLVQHCISDSQGLQKWLQECCM